jgi:hypothetical protein
MATLISRKLLETTPRDAKGYLDLEHLEEQKHRYQSWRKNIIADLIKNDEFRHGCISVASLNGQKFQLDGHHTCTAIIEVGIPVECVVEQYKCDSLDDLSALYRAYDAVWSARHLRLLVAIENNSLGYGWSNLTANLLITAFSLNDPTFQNLPCTEKPRVLRPHRKEGDFIQSIIIGDDKKKCQFLARGATCAAMLRTWAKHQEQAHLFWTRVREGENLMKRDPELLLRDFLRSSSMHVRKGFRRTNSGIAGVVDNHEVMYRCILAWNARRRNERVTQLRYHRDKAPPKAI